MKPEILFLTAALVVSRAASARGEAGRSGTEFLKIIPSPRAAAMGAAGAALADDHLSALSLNPAALGQLEYPEASLLYNRWIEGVSLQNLAFAYPIKGVGTLGFSGTLLDVAPIPGFDAAGGPAEAVTVRDVALKAAYARRLFGPLHEREGLFIGVGLKHVRSQLEKVSATTLLGDAGLLYARSVGRSRLGAAVAVESLGPGLRFDRDRDPPPTATRLGLSATSPVGPDPLSLVLDVRAPFDDDLAVGLGVEYGIRRLVYPRIGWDYAASMGEGLTFGLGFRLQVFSVDYALVPFGDFGFGHRVALSVRFGGPKETWMPVSTTSEQALWHMRKGDLLLQEQRHAEAAIQYNEALKIDPRNENALRKLRLLLELMERSQ